MRILAIHNTYQHRGGEDGAHEAKVRLLRSKGHDVREIIFDNKTIGRESTIAAGLGATWRHSSFRAVSAGIESFRPDVLDVDNFFPLASPSIYYAAKSRSIPVVQTLHNFRLLCPGATFFRNGAACEECIGRSVPLPGILHGCYRKSRFQTAGVALMLASHNLLGTWHSKVTLFVALTDFARDRFIRGGLPSDRIVVRPNFVTDQGVGEGAGNYILYVGRLSVEKGIPMLLRAWRAVKTGKLIIVGEGPLEGMVRDEARLSQGVSYIGRQPAAKVRELMSNAVALAFPSLWYEGLPGVMIEAFSHGTPVVANRLGAMEHLVRHTQTGWLVEPGAEAEFAAALINAQERPQDNVGMRAQARAEFESKYNAERGYELLMSTYARAFALNEQRG